MIRRFWLLLFLLNSVYLFGQVKDNLSLNQTFKKGISFSSQQLDSALYYFQAMQEMAAKEGKLDSTFLALKWKVQCTGDFNKFSQQYVYLEETEKTFFEWNEALGDSLCLELSNDIDAFWGGYYFRIGRFDEGILYNHNVINNLEAKEVISQRDSFLIFRSHSFIAQMYQRKGNFQMAIRHFWEGISFIQNHVYQQQIGRVGLTISQIASCYKSLGEKEKARQFYRNAISEVSEFYPAQNHKMQRRVNKNLLVAYQSLADYYLEINQLDSAIWYFQSSLQLEKDPLFRVSYDGLAKAYTLKGDFQKAENNLEQSFKIKKESLGAKHYSLGISYSLKGQLLIQQGKIRDALNYYDLALTQFGLFPARNFSGLPGKNEILKTLSYKAKTLYQQYLNEKATSVAEEGLETVLLALELMNEIRKDFGEDWDKQLMLDQRYHLIEWALLFSFDNEKLSKYLLLELVEMGKASVLLDAVQYQNAKKNANIPAVLLKEEGALKSEISSLKVQLFHEISEEEVIEIEKELLEKNLLFKDNQQRIQKYARRVDAIIEEVPEQLLLQIQSTLGRKEALIEYFLGKDFFYIVLITPNTYKVWQKPIPNNFQLKVLEFRNSILDADQRMKNDALADYKQSAFELKEILLKEVFQELKPSINQLIIIPDGYLGYLPFEILISDSHSGSSFKDLPYLLNSFDINYAYSAQLLLEQLNAPYLKKSKTLGGFAPSYRGNQHLLAYQNQVRSFEGLPPLAGAKEEVKTITTLFNGDPFLEEDASEATFREKVNDYQILLLAMHALANEQYPDRSCLLFTPNASVDRADDILYAVEIYSLIGKMELLVLSACNTGYGMVQRGEGMISLSRAFMQGGTIASVQSLWKAPDKATAQIMISFFEKLKAGVPKHKALKQSKLSYLAKQKGVLSAHPYFWAGFVPAGNMRPLPANNLAQWISRNWLTTAVFLLGVPLLVLVFKADSINPWLLGDRGE